MYTTKVDRKWYPTWSLTHNNNKDKRSTPLVPFLANIFHRFSVLTFHYLGSRVSSYTEFLCSLQSLVVGEFRTIWTFYTNFTLFLFCWEFPDELSLFSVSMRINRELCGPKGHRVCPFSWHGSRNNRGLKVRRYVKILYSRKNFGIKSFQNKKDDQS